MWQVNISLNTFMGSVVHSHMSPCAAVTIVFFCWSKSHLAGFIWNTVSPLIKRHRREHWDSDTPFLTCYCAKSLDRKTAHKCYLVEALIFIFIFVSVLNVGKKIGSPNSFSVIR